MCNNIAKEPKRAAAVVVEAMVEGVEEAVDEAVGVVTALHRLMRRVRLLVLVGAVADGAVAAVGRGRSRSRAAAAPAAGVGIPQSSGER